jgi:hypothetical protein
MKSDGWEIGGLVSLVQSYEGPCNRFVESQPVVLGERCDDLLLTELCYQPRVERLEPFLSLDTALDPADGVGGIG